MRVTYGNSSSGGNGIGFAGMLTVAFIVLKLANVIDWSWWWVLSPLWISAIIGAIIVCLLILLRKY
jgi:hypothetical protein